MSTFDLQCPDCLAVNTIESEGSAIGWECDSCNSQPFTSLPTDDDGELIDGE